MSHLRAKWNHTLNKLNDKFKRQRASVVNPQGSNAVPGKEPRNIVPEMTLPSLAAGSTHLPPTFNTASAMSANWDTSYYETSAVPSKGNTAKLGAMQPTTLPPGSVANPIANSKTPTAFSPVGLPNTNDLNSSSLTTSPHGQKRFWTEPSPLDSSDANYVARRKSKMTRSTTSSCHDQLATSHQRTVGPPIQATFEPPKTEALTSFPQNGRSAVDTESRVRPYQTEDDLASFIGKILATKCNACALPLFDGVGSVVTAIRDQLHSSRLVHAYQACHKCQAVGCVACGAQPSQRVEELQYSGLAKRRESRKGSWCCSGGRLFLVWALLCGPEFNKLEVPQGSGSWGKLKGKLKAPKPDVKPETTVVAGKANQSLPRALSKGVGYEPYEGSQASATGLRWDMALSSSASKPTPDGELFGTYFEELGALLLTFQTTMPPPSGDLSSFKTTTPPTSGEDQPPPMVNFMLRRSPVLIKAVELLRIDSIEAMAMQSEMYHSLLRLIVTISRYPSTSAVVYGDYIIYPPEEQLGHFSTSRSGSTVSNGGGRSVLRGKGKQLEYGSSIVKIIENLARQCRHLNRVAYPHMQELLVGETSKMFPLSRAICDLAMEHRRHQGLLMGPSNQALPDGWTMQATSNVLTRSKEQEKSRERYSELHRDACVMDVPDDELLLNFRFRDNAARVDAATVLPGRMRKLVAQIASLRTSLPEGIWVRHGSSRLDMMKVLMVGPKGTPYEHGLFEFDLFCPAQFPAVPPMMFFRTTGGGKVRFNPNLYDDGKVCLSLLGTWPGEGWNGNYSTLLQVLVSIHGMILVEQPWYNEPGRERRLDKAASNHYNLAIQAYTLQWAITDWLSNRILTASSAESPWATATDGQTRSSGPWSPNTQTALVDGVTTTRDDPIWGEIIRMHFAANGKAILETWQKRSKPFKEECKLRDALAQHGFI